MARVRKPCSVEGCEKLSRCLGLCQMHYFRWRRHGMTDRRYDPFERFMTHFDLDPSSCWLWNGQIGSQGYGVLGPHVSVHRFSYERFVGPIPQGLEIDHVCHNIDPLCSGNRACLHRRCVNPAHLEAVSHDENVRRSKLRRQAAKAAA